MRARPFFLSFLLLASLSGTLFAISCGEDAYGKSCSQCAFDQSGRMDRGCYQRFENEGVACTAASDVVAATKYKEGKCEPVARCVRELEACKASASTGNDSLDCRVGSVSNCFEEADECFELASDQCHDITSEDVGNLICPGGSLAILFALGFAYSRRGKARAGSA